MYLMMKSSEKYRIKPSLAVINDEEIKAIACRTLTFYKAYLAKWRISVRSFLKMMISARLGISS
jgi:hypothetical protein